MFYEYAHLNLWQSSERPDEDGEFSPKGVIRLTREMNSQTQAFLCV